MPSRHWRLADYPRLHRVAYGIFGDPVSPEDATQQAYLDIWRNLRRLRDPAKYEAWSYRLLVRACYAEAKRQTKWATSDDCRLPRNHGGRCLRWRPDRDQLERGLQRLSMDHRVVLALRHLLGMTPEEVSATLGISRWTVY